MTVDRFMAPTFSKILNEIWTDVLQFWQHTHPNVRPWVHTRLYQHRCERLQLPNLHT